MFKQYWVYIVECSDKSFYTGVTNNIERRLSEHNNDLKFNKYTDNRRPVKLVFSALYFDINQAIYFEKQIKGWSRKKKLALINDRLEELPELSKRHAPNSHSSNPLRVTNSPENS